MNRLVRVSVALVFITALVPVAAQAGEDKTADAKCNPVVRQCAYGSGKRGSKCNTSGNMWGKKCCSDIKPVCGECVEVNNCKGLSYVDQQGQSQSPGNAGGFGEIMKQAMSMLQQMMQQKQQGGGGGGGASQQGQLPEQGCRQYYQVTTPSTDPCAYYVPPTSDSLLQSSGISGSDALVDALTEGSSLNVSDTLLSALGSPAVDTGSQSETSGDTGATSGTTSTPTTGGLSAQQANLQSGTRGDIVVSEGGATIVAQARDAGANTEVAGFYGSDGSGAQQQGIVAGMCKSRPWASSIVSFVIPPVFFDGLCAWRGYQVGAPPPPPPPPAAAVQQAATVATTSAATSQTVVPAVQPRVEIWAVPEKVSLGTRTSIFWNASGVASCSITSPDGSFNENSLSGGAATVPLSGPTTFTISCLTAAGAPVTDYVTVQLAI